jgi:integrase
MFKEPTRRIRWLTREQAGRLLDALPQYLKFPAQFSLATGLRQGNVLELEWSQVDLQRQVAWVHPDQAKARKAIPVPLNDEALEAIREQIGKHEKYIFVGAKGERIHGVGSKPWKQALKKSNITDFRWHDLRHTWASWHVQAGTPLHVLQELGGWESASMVRRYAHLAPDHLKGYADNVKMRTIWAHPPEIQAIKKPL